MAFSTDQNQSAADNTDDLISSEKVDGTAVYNRQGDKLGSIHHIMIGKRSGEVRYAVLSFGGVFGIGNNYYPLPWNVLTYEPDKGGYVIDLDQDVLEKAPSYGRDAEPSWGSKYDEKVYGHYGVRYYDPADPGIRGVADDYRS